MSEREILDQLIEAGKITEEDVSKIMTPEKRELVEIVHLMTCVKDHDVGECSWYLEEQMDGTWKRPDHVQWISNSESILREFNLSVSEAISSFNRIRIIIGEATRDRCMELLRFILSSNSTKLIPEGRTKNSSSGTDSPGLSG